MLKEIKITKFLYEIEKLKGCIVSTEKIWQIFNDSIITYDDAINEDDTDYVIDNRELMLTIGTYYIGIGIFERKYDSFIKIHDKPFLKLDCNNIAQYAKYSLN